MFHMLNKSQSETQQHYPDLLAEYIYDNAVFKAGSMEYPEQHHNHSPTKSPSTESMSSSLPLYNGGIDHKSIRYPHCIVWTPIPCLSWLFPVIGHMGIAMTSGVIRDFAGPYFVSEDNMAFGNPTRYWQLPLDKVPAANSKDSWDRSVYEASEVYKGRMHNLFCDNCHSHVSCALNKMRYDNSASWNMVKLCLLMLVKGKNVSCCGWLKQWLPFLILASIILVVVLATRL